MKRIKTICLTCILGLAMIALSLAIFLPKTVTSNLMNPYPQDESYEKEWKTIDSLINTGLPQSALKLTDEIYLEAKKTIDGDVVGRVEEYDSHGAEQLANSLMEQAVEDQAELDFETENSTGKLSEPDNDKFEVVATDSDIEQAEQELNLDGEPT